jgi:hypothetical protein
VPLHDEPPSRGGGCVTDTHKVTWLTRAWRWRPQSRAAVVVFRLGCAAVFFLVSALVLRDARYGAIFAGCWIAVGVPLDLLRLRRDAPGARSAIGAVHGLVRR